ncbi:Aste57867_9687 [Aphanomyces stellatus]|uniref:Aste57867_9687 protein n=1 Tax=Aphanomyces stellatus TaxID=120398 RepID=A0A485KNX4_9STRA|nr:hypothetical protein As57867_009649 [Aphanomyces stellatus]VFT86566.1 Aste57867_9687 [Aphanomyces stellatus]
MMYFDVRLSTDRSMEKERPQFPFPKQPCPVMTFVPTFSDPKDVECPLCYDLFRDPVQVDATCRHHFCRPCIQGWLQDHESCPCDRNVCVGYSQPAPQLMAALSQVEFTCDCLWEGKWVDHQTCPLVKCSWCNWTSYTNGKSHVVSKAQGESARSQHLVTCPSLEHAVPVDRWVNGAGGLRFGMSVNDVHEWLFGDSIDYTFSDYPLAPEVTNFECRYFWHPTARVSNKFPDLPSDVLYNRDSYCCFLFEKDAGLRCISFRLFELNDDDDTMPRCLTYFSQHFKASLDAQRAAVVPAIPNCTIAMSHLRGKFHDEPGLLQTFVEFVDPRNVPLNGLNYGLSA